MSVPQSSRADGHLGVAARVHRDPSGVAVPGPDLLDEYLQRTAAGDRVAFRTLYDLLSPDIRDSAACLFGRGDHADNITNSVFIDVWQMAGQYQPGGDGVRTWVLNVAGTHTMSRYRPNTGEYAGGRDEFVRHALDALLAAGPRITAPDQNGV